MRRLTHAQRHRGDRSQDGSATAELAVAMPAVFVLMGLALGCFGAAGLNIRLADAAADAARALGRGESAQAAQAIASRNVPGAHLATTRNDGIVCVEAVADLRIGGGRAALAIPLSSRACALDGGR